MTDVFYADQICYINDVSDINQAHSVCFSIMNAVNLYQKTFLYRYYDQINAETIQVQEAMKQGKSIIDSDFPTMTYKRLLMAESVTDNFLIGTFFEVIAKAFILNQGALVHKIKPTRAASQQIKDYAQNQKKIPVDAKSYIQHDPFADYEGIGRNGLKYLSTETLSYGWLYESGYLAMLPFSPDFKNDAGIFRTLRNQIHFPLVGASESIMNLGTMSNDPHMTVMNEINTTIKPLFDTLNRQYRFNFNLSL